WREREVAAWMLGHMSLNPEEKDVAASALMDTLENARREGLWPCIGRAALRACLLALPFSLILSFDVTLNEGYPHYIPPWPVLFCQMQAVFSAIAFPFAGPASLVYDGLLNNRVRATSAVALGHLGVPESVGVLAGALFDRSQRVQSAAA